MKPDVKERPILFSDPMVRALLAGLKSQTRRLVSPRVDFARIKPDRGWRYDGIWTAEDGGDNGHYFWRRDERGRLTRDFVSMGRCPFGVTGERLWVREAWCRVPWAAKTVTEYRASWGRADGGLRWKSPIHMPRAESRILLEVTDVRIEWLQEITESDALAEGTASLMRGYTRYTGEAVDIFRRLWGEIHGRTAWNVNPLVWVIQFRRLEPA